jgi:hypothetical protein
LTALEVDTGEFWQADKDGSCAEDDGLRRGEFGDRPDHASTPDSLARFAPSFPSV